MRKRLRIAFIASTIAWCLGIVSAQAQSLDVGQNLGAARQNSQPAKLAQVRPAQPQISMPPAEDLLGLIRATLIALNQANQTGNYTVLRDLGAGDFRNVNDASRLGAIFQVLREQAVDLTPLLRISPEVSRPPAITGEGLLTLVGFFPTQPLRVNFDLAFQLSGNIWRPYAISVFLATAPELAPPPTALAPVANLDKRKK